MSSAKRSTTKACTSTGMRSTISTNSFPRLQTLNKQFAGRFGKQAEALLNVDASVEFIGLSKDSYGDVCESSEGLGLIIEFTPKPLDGAAMIHFDGATVRHLVETFFGGQGNESEGSEAEFFTPGEINIAKLISGSILSTLTEIWAPLAQIDAEIVMSVIDQGVAHWSGTSGPAGDGNVVLAGHRTTHSQPFHDLDRLDAGDLAAPNLGRGRRLDEDAAAGGGGFGQAFYDAYEEAWPLDRGYSIRKTLYNLYHVLNHLNMFGGGYGGQALTMIDRLLAELGH